MMEGVVISNGYELGVTLAGAGIFFYLFLKAMNT